LTAGRSVGVSLCHQDQAAPPTAQQT